ncbi:uncharacterized protein LOC131613836 [Vicia villosa]|uniref:uncharacterized protein LOC131613836 n=1 Tax=Vicia villosa TaxID=3911 RepID=UPI00273B2249|nr:uncharacterized protein LOC131613836 [Vicia villosa]
MIIGDFNNVMTNHDRIGGKQVNLAEYTDLEQMMEDVGLFSRETKGEYFTWNNRHANNMIYSRIDHAICNRDWFSQFPHCIITVMHPHISDHAPLRVQMLGRDTLPKRRSNFKFLNCITDRAEFIDTVRQNWDHSGDDRPMYKVWRNLKKLQPSMRELSKNTTENVKHIQQHRLNLQQAQAELLQDRFNGELVNKITQLTTELMTASELEEQILKQKAKVDWFLLGDGNNRYFYEMLKSKNKAAGIYALEDSNGMEVTGQDSIEREVLKFYGDLIGKASNQLRHINVEVLRSGNQLSHAHQMELIQSVIEKEILAALKSIGDTKAPGIDGYCNTPHIYV